LTHNGEFVTGTLIDEEKPRRKFKQINNLVLRVLLPRKGKSPGNEVGKSRHRR